MSSRTPATYSLPASSSRCQRGNLVAATRSQPLDAPTNAAVQSVERDADDGQGDPKRERAARRAAAPHHDPPSYRPDRSAFPSCRSLVVRSTVLSPAAVLVARARSPRDRYRPWSAAPPTSGRHPDRPPQAATARPPIRAVKRNQVIVTSSIQRGHQAFDEKLSACSRRTGSSLPQSTASTEPVSFRPRQKK